MLISCATTIDPAANEAIDPGDVSFEKNIKPLFQESCLHCHDGSTAAGDLDLRSRQLAFRPSPNGPFIVPGYPDRSKIFRMVNLADAEPGAMPPTGHALTEQQLEHLKIWISQGAEWPSDESGHLQATTGMSWRSQ